MGLIMFAVVVVMLQCVLVVPLEIAFVDCPLPWFPFLLDIMFSFDVLATLFTAILTRNQPPVCSLTGIGYRYLSGSMLFDVVITVPFYRLGNAPELRILKGITCVECGTVLPPVESRSSGGEIFNYR